MKNKLFKAVALVAIVAALSGTHTYGQAAVPNTNAPLVIQATNADANIGSQTIEIAPEVRAEMLRAAAEEIGAPAPGDLDNLLARHAALKQQILAVQQRHPRASTNAPIAPLPSASTGALTPVSASGFAPAASPTAGLKPTGLKPRQPLPSDQLAHVINELSDINAQLTETPPSAAGQ